MSEQNQYAWLLCQLAIAAAQEDDERPPAGALTTFQIIPEGLIGSAGCLRTPTKRSANDPNLRLACFLALILLAMCAKQLSNQFNPGSFFCQTDHGLFFYAIPLYSPWHKLFPVFMTVFLLCHIDPLPTLPSPQPPLPAPPAEGTVPRLPAPGTVPGRNCPGA